MLDLKIIQENFEEVKKKLANRGQPQVVTDLDEVYHLSTEIKDLTQQAQVRREKETKYRTRSKS